MERDGFLKSKVKDAVQPTRYCQAQHCNLMSIMIFEDGKSTFNAFAAPGHRQLKTDIDAQTFAVSALKPSIFGANFVLVLNIIHELGACKGCYCFDAMYK